MSSMYNLDNALYVHGICERHGIEIDIVTGAPRMIRIMRKLGGKGKFAKWVEDNADEIRNILSK